VSDAKIGVLGLPLIEISGLTATSTSTCDSATGNVTLKLLVAGAPVTVTTTPNSGIDLGGGARLIVNEQIPVNGATHGLTVNAVHLAAAGGAVDVVVGSSTSAVHNCA